MSLLRGAVAQVRARLIPDARRAWRFASVQIATAGVATELLLQTGLVDQLLPASSARWVTTGLFASVILGRLVAQRAPEATDGR